MSQNIIAFEYKLPLEQVRQMDIEDFLEKLAYLNIKNEEEKKAVDKAGKK